MRFRKSTQIAPEKQMQLANDILSTRLRILSTSTNTHTRSKVLLIVDHCCGPHDWLTVTEPLPLTAPPADQQSPGTIGNSIVL